MKGFKFENFCQALFNYEDKGVRITIQGIGYPARKIAEILSLRGFEGFMPDFVLDSYGEVIEINYDRVAMT